MQLNIYIISHPVIRLLSNSINYDKNHNFISDKYNYIGLLLIYEIMRKCIKTQSIYIKKINFIEKIYHTDPNEKYYIITNLINTYSMITNIKKIIPEIQLIHIENKEKNFAAINQINKLNLLKNNKKIIIFDDILYESNIIELIKYIIENTKVSINNIQIACLACYNQLLDKLGSRYPTLNIYTTKIIQ